MPAPYSYDLRTKAIEAVKVGERKSEVCRMFNISRNTLDLWLKREAQTGDYQAITNFQQGYQHKISEWKRFEELAKLWGDNVTQQNISDALMKLGLSRKKRHRATENGTTSSVRSLESD